MESPRICVLIGGDVSEREGLRRIPVAMVAKGFKGKQKFAVTRADLAQIVTNFRKRATGDLVIDYDHGVEFAAGSGQPVPAAGWLTEIDDAPDGQGVLWGWARFNERAAAMLAANEYRYVSPVIVWGARDKATGEAQGTTVTSIALTNSPVLERLPALVCSEAGWEICRGDAGDRRQNVVKAILADRVARTVRVVAEDGAEQTVTLEGLEAQPRVIRMSDVTRGSDGRLAFGSLPQDGDVLVAGEVVRAMVAQGELDQAVAAGKITPAQRGTFEKIAMSDLATFRDVVAAMPVQVKVGVESGVAGTGEEKGGLAQVETLIASAVEAKQKANAELTYGAALRLVSSEQPELMARKLKLQRAQKEDE